MASLTSNDPWSANKLITTSEQMQQIRREQALGNPGPRGEYPRTIIGRKRILKHETRDLNNQTFSYDFGEGPKEFQQEIVDSFKLGLKYIPDNSKARESIKYLKKRINGEERWKNLPIYWINGHSNIEIKLILKPPAGMSPEKVREEIEYDYISQIREKFELERAPTNLAQNEPAPSDFFETAKGVFVAITTPIGYDAKCGDWNQSYFLKRGSKDNFSGLRNILMSERYAELFAHNNSNIITSFTPPHNSALNKTYRFFDDIPRNGSVYSTDKWGVIRLDTIEDENFLKNHNEKIKIETTTDKLRALNPGNHGKIKNLIKRSVNENFDISLKQITSILGPGIYLDAACSGMSIKIWDSYKNRWSTFGPDKISDFNRVQPIYDIIMDDFDIMRRWQKLSWSNIVSKDNVHCCSQKEENLINYSNFTAHSTTASSASNRSRSITESRNEGEQKEDEEMPARTHADQNVHSNLSEQLTQGGAKRKARNKKTRKRRKRRKSRKSKKSKKRRKTRKYLKKR